MPINNYFDTVFAVGGTLTTVPDDTDPSGYVSFFQGYTPDYELLVGDPNYKPIERGKMNYLFNQLTGAAQQYQQQGVPLFITSLMNGGSPYSYTINTRVISGGVIYKSLIDANTDTPPSANWEIEAIIGLTEQASTPTTPPVTVSKLYFSDDGTLRSLDSNGLERIIGGASYIYAGWHLTPRANEIPVDGSSIAKTSGGTYNGAQYANAYAYAWDNLSNTYAPVAGGRGGSAAADFAANKTITLPDYRNCTLVGVLAGNIVPSPGQVIGAATVTPTGTAGTTGSTTLSTDEMPSHVHSITTRKDQAGSDDFILEEISSSIPGSQNTNATGGGGSHSHTGGSLTMNASSVVQPSGGIYWYLTF